MISTEKTMAKWIQVQEEHDLPVGSRPVYLLRKEFTIGSVEAASLKISAQGIYTAFINGNRVGNYELTPGYTEYAKRIQFQTYDVTDLLQEGVNAIAVELADGWFRGAVGITQRGDQYGNRVALFAELASTAGKNLVETDATWRIGASDILSADLFQGQHQDLNLRQPAAYLPGFECGADFHGQTWRAPLEIEVLAELFPQAVEPNQVVEYLKPRSIRQLRPGVHIVDFGQNSNGWVRLSKLGPKGNKVTITHGEWLNQDGDVTLDHLAVNFPNFPKIDCLQIDSVISDGRAESVFEPRYTTHGFQFVRVEGLAEPLSIDDIQSAVVHANLKRIGHFESSDERLNWLHSAATWSFRGNACDVPTDCPTRERSGWSGDWQIFTGTAAYLFDIREFNRKFLADARLGQFENGIIPNVIPSDQASLAPGFMLTNNGSSGWGDMIVESPLQTYLATGDLSFLSENFDAMVRWVDFAVERAATLRHASRAELTKGAFEDYLWDGGFHWGEWLEPSVDMSDFMAFMGSDKGAVATAYLHRSARDLAHIAEILGKPQNLAEHYAEIAVKVKAAWQEAFLNADGSLSSSSPGVATQANYVRALHFGLIPTGLESAAAEHLVKLIRANGTRLDTGFLSTVYLLPTLADFGHADLAIELLFQNQEPSWMNMRNRGATTVWERWNGVAADGTPSESLNHYSKGSVIDFLHQYISGLKIVEPGYREFGVKPVLGAGIEWARTSHQSPFGLISVEWKLSIDGFQIELLVPQGTKAHLTLPNGIAQTLGAGEHTLAYSL
jgi:alpha-L-rhamnosidase